MLPFCAECLTPGYVADFLVITSSHFPGRVLRNLNDLQHFERNIRCPGCFSNTVVEVGRVLPNRSVPVTQFEIPPEKKPKSIRELADLVKDYLKNGYVLVRDSKVLDDFAVTLILFNLENCPDQPINADKRKAPWIPESTEYLAFCPVCHCRPAITVKGTKRVNLLKETVHISVRDIEIKCKICDTEPIWFRIPKNGDLSPGSVEGPFRVKFLPMGNGYYSIAEDYREIFDRSELERLIKTVLTKIQKPLPR